MKAIIAIIMSIFFIGAASAQDDRYFDSRANNWAKVNTHKQQVKVVKKKHIKYAREHRTRKVRTAVKQVPKYEGETYSPDPVQWVTKRVARGVGEVLGGRPHGAPSRWCGYWLGQHLGILKRHLWVARNWAGVGAPAARQVGVVVVWKHHVGLITDVSGARIKVLSGNDGHRVRNRWRTVRGVIAYRRV